LTGAAAWSYFSATQYILGLRPEADGLRIDPCIPKTWNGFTVKRKFRDRIIYIQIKNPSHLNKGVNQMILNGKSIPGNLIPFTLLEPENYIEIILGD
jgi:cellobiose phosphorylase